MRVVVIGAGLVGLATASQLIKRAPAATVHVVEKEAAVGRHQSTHNSGVLHAGVYYKPGSLKARLAVTGIRRMVEFCRENGIAHEICGKLVVATNDAEIERLRTLLERGSANGLRGLRWVARDELREIEPHVAGVAGLHVPEEGIVDYGAVCAALETRFREGGGRVSLNTRVVRIVRRGSESQVETTGGSIPADFVVNCAGLHSDRVAAAAGENSSTRIIPFRGEYYRLRPAAERLVRNLIYPVPDPTFPFLGVHFTRLISGGVEAGPNAVLALDREAYTRHAVRWRDAAEALTFPGLWRFMRQHRSMAWDEVKRSFSKRRFCASLQRLVPELTESDLLSGGAGVRAQAMTPDGTLVQDFNLLEGDRSLHVVNAPSHAATASLAIGEWVAGRAIELSGRT